jgi:hypothetical protein
MHAVGDADILDICCRERADIQECLEFTLEKVQHNESIYISA